MQQEIFLLILLVVTTSGVEKINIYPGYGWDHLRFIDMNAVYTVANLNDSEIYQSCIDVIPIRQNFIDLTSTVIDTYDLSTSDYTENLVIDNVELFIISAGKYSETYQHTKLRQIQESLITIRNQIDYALAEVIVSNRCPLDPQVKREIIQIANYRTTEEETSASYAAQLFVKKYGTHFTSRAILGGSIIEEDFIKINKYNSSATTKRGFEVSAKISFLKSFKLGFSFDTSYKEDFSDIQIQGYDKNITRKVINSKGGDVFLLDAGIASWQASLKTHPVIIRRSVENITNVIRSELIPELSESDLAFVRHEIHEAITAYAQMNLIPGCTDRNSRSFNYQAIVDDGTCVSVSQNEQFGGFIRTCTETSGMTSRCGYYTVRNFYTQNNECPTNFYKYLLHNTVQHETIYERRCSSCYLFFTCCDNRAVGLGQRSLALYGCAANVRNLLSSSNETSLKVSLEYAYGGSFTRNKVNPVTGSKNCLQDAGFSPVVVTTELTVCLAERANSVQNLPYFGGIYSCLTDNKTCPEGYSSFAMDALDSTCFLYVCLKFVDSGERRNLIPIALPPFMTAPIRNDTRNLTGRANTNDNIQLSNLTVKEKRNLMAISTTALTLSGIIILAGMIYMVSICRRFGRYQDIDRTGATELGHGRRSH